MSQTLEKMDIALLTEVGGGRWLGKDRGWMYLLDVRHLAFLFATF